VLFEDDLVCVQETGDLYRRFLAALGRPRNESGLRDVVSHVDTHAAEQLNPLGDRIDKFILLLVARQSDCGGAGPGPAC
jgi:hypothetical protein